MEITGTNKYYREILKLTIEALDRRSLLSINDLLKDHKKHSEEDVIKYFMNAHTKEMEMANYQAHYGQASRLQDFILIGYPEYAVDSLIRKGYLVSRRKAIVPRDEEILFSALEKMEEKYCPRKVVSLKKRLGIY